MGIEIRIAVPEDAFAVCDVLRRSISECCVQDHQNRPEILQAWLGNKTPQNVAGWFVSPANHVLVAERAGVVVGVALLTQAGKLSLCYVLPEALHSGIGTALLQAAEAQARTWGVSVLRLNSPVSASKFWKKLNGAAAAGVCPNAAEAAPRKRFCSCSGQ
jgi:GNAT superfamily N-acetyltransferase